MLPKELTKKIIEIKIIVDFCNFPTSLAEGQLYQASYNQKEGLLRLRLVSENRDTSNTTLETTCS